MSGVWRNSGPRVRRRIGFGGCSPIRRRRIGQNRMAGQALGEVVGSAALIVPFHGHQIVRATVDHVR